MPSYKNQKGHLLLDCGDEWALSRLLVNGIVSKSVYRFTTPAPVIAIKEGYAQQVTQDRRKLIVLKIFKCPRVGAAESHRVALSVETESSLALVYTG